MKIFIGIFFIFILLIFLKIKIKIESCKNSKFILKFTIYILNSLKIFEMFIGKKSVKILKKEIYFQNFKFPKIDKNMFNAKKIKNYLNISKVKIEKFDFNLNIGCEEIAVTVFLVFLISNILSIICSKFAKPEKCKYLITPVYNLNELKFDLNIIFSFRIINLFLYKLIFLVNNIRKV